MRQCVCKTSLFPIIVSLELWGDFFANKRLLFSTDNKGVAFAVNSLSYLRHLVFLCLKWNIWIKAKYISGKTIIIADALSSLQMDRFFELLPEAELVGTPCPSHLWDLIRFFRTLRILWLFLLGGIILLRGYYDQLSYCPYKLLFTIIQRI